MCRLIETLKVKEGEIFQIEEHDYRMNKARKELWNSHNQIALSARIKDIPQEGMWKCRVLYQKEIEEIQFFPYVLPEITSLKVVRADAIDYAYKYENRKSLKALYEKRGERDDILIIKDGKVTDSYFCNVVFEKEGDLFTPSSPLLKGTKRRYLLEQGIIKEADIREDNIRDFDRLVLINAMIELEDNISVDIENILL